jgi:hypothetical protein
MGGLRITHARVHKGLVVRLCHMNAAATLDDRLTTGIKHCSPQILHRGAIMLMPSVPRSPAAGGRAVRLLGLGPAEAVGSGRELREGPSTPADPDGVQRASRRDLAGRPIRIRPTARTGSPKSGHPNPQRTAAFGPLSVFCPPAGPVRRATG